MIRVLFVCHGNICRSPLAEYLFKDIARKAGMEDLFTVSSAATSYEELGNPVYPPVRRILEARGIECTKKRAVRMNRSDYDAYDWLICMDGRNLRGLRDIIDDDAKGKVHLLMEFAGTKRDVADPYYSGDFDACLRDIEEGCRGLFRHLTEFTEKRSF